jgi:hypothetical protein
MNTKTHETEIGNYDIKIEVTLTEDVDGWLTGTADVAGTMRDYRSKRIGFDGLRVGCYIDCDNDHDSWSADMEGARVLSALVSGEGSPRPFDINPGNWCELFPIDCDQICGIVCGLLREAHAEAQEVES